MSLTAATLVPGLLLLALGLPLLLARSGAIAALKAFPRSTQAAVVCFGGGAAWFLYNILHLSAADFGDYRNWIFLAFAAIAALSFKHVSDFLSVRGASMIVLLGASPLLNAAYMEYSHPQRLLMVSAVYLGIALAIWLGAQPWRLRDFFEWVFARPGRTRAVGALLATYGLVLCVTALTY